MIPAKDQNLFINPIREAISNHTSDHFIVNMNYEIVVPENGSILLHPNYYDISTLKKLFDRIYENKNGFVSNDLEVEVKTFLHRLNALGTFFKKIGKDPSPVSKIIRNIRQFDGTVKVDAVTFRIFNDGSQIVANPLLSLEVKSLLQGFCQQQEMSQKDLLHSISNPL